MTGTIYLKASNPEGNITIAIDDETSKNRSDTDPSNDTDTDTDNLSNAADALRAVLNVGDRFRHVTARYFSIGESDARAMNHLLTAGGSLTPAALTHELELSSSSLTALLDRLEAAGLTARHRHPHDRRKVVIALTDRGTELVTHLHDWITSALALLDPNLLPASTDLLTQVAAALHTQTDDLERANMFNKP